MRTKKHRHRGRRGPCFCRRHKHLRGGGIADWWSSVTDKTKSWWQGLGTGCPACDTEKAAAAAEATPPDAPAPEPQPAPPMQNPFDIAPPVAPAPAAPAPPMQNPFDIAPPPQMPNMMPAPAAGPTPLPFEPPQQDMPQAPPMTGGRRRRRRTRKHRRSRSRSRHHRRTKKHRQRRRRYRGGQGDFLTHDEKGSLATYASDYMGAPTAQPQVWTA